MGKFQYLFCGLLVVTGVSGLGCAQHVNFSLPDTSNAFSSSVAYNNKVDIIWLMDNSSSMRQHQTTLSQQVPLLVQKLNALKLDYHMATITTSMGSGGDGGHFIGGSFLTNSSPEVAAQLSSLLVVGENGGNLERGVDSLLAALSPNYLASDAARGFLRDDAFLAVIVLSDEDDQSARQQSEVLTALDGLKPPRTDGTRSWSLNFIGVLADSSQCRTYNNYSDLGLFYMSLADASSGSKESICAADYAGAVGNIRQRLVQTLSDYHLDKLPVVSSLVVKINGEIILQDALNGWSYIAAKNVVRFNGNAIPAADATIVIDFTPASAN